MAIGCAGMYRPSRHEVVYEVVIREGRRLVRLTITGLGQDGSELVVQERNQVRLCRAIIRFALSSPGLFRVRFPALLRPRMREELHEARRSLRSRLRSHPSDRNDLMVDLDNVRGALYQLDCVSVPQRIVPVWPPDSE